jgi:hypothetical protein
MDPAWLLAMLRERIAERACLRLIRKWLKAGILETDGQVSHPATGTPQGGPVAPGLANVYLPYALDLWFDKVVKTHCRGEALRCRYADAWGCAFRSQDAAQRFYRVLPKRLEQCNLQAATEKPPCCGSAGFLPVCGGASPFWASSLPGPQIGRVCRAARGARHARGSRRPASGSRNGSNSTGTSRGVRAARV